MLRRDLQHLCNGLHLYCRLRDMGLPKPAARFAANVIAWLFWPVTYGGIVDNLASRKMVISVVAVLAIALNAKLNLGLDKEGIAAIVTVATTGIGTQGAIDMLNSWLARKTAQPPAAPQEAQNVKA